MGKLPELRDQITFLGCSDRLARRLPGFASNLLNHWEHFLSKQFSR